LAQEGDYRTARPLQLALIEVNNAITTRFGIAGLKAAMDLVGLAGGAPRPPLLPLSAADLSSLRTSLMKAGLI
jgi:4-hydroxy-2-oxoglutarate aldolase